MDLTDSLRGRSRNSDVMLVDLSSSESEKLWHSLAYKPRLALGPPLFNRHSFLRVDTGFVFEFRTMSVSRYLLHTGSST